MKWSNFLDPGNDKVANLMVKTVMRKNLSLSKIILLKKNSNFLDIFDKTQTDVLL